ncbi:hypothetical protein [Metabacillus malikii]|uniref:CHASE2 domain-containing sensor protein n=1 Tax=Metabacillus malikii TaxID=1504265 RepID=A0ABT9ZBW3_9BACI|nr:hypothetical protein [Metabacillus malikii]MDQ0229083.1 CHASE2 domain-containing sensor protein [Metabacillus malikii]
MRGTMSVIPTLLTVILIVTLIISITIVVKKRRKAGITGIKSALTSICFYAIGIINLVAYWFDFLGLVSWTLSFILILLGAYFMKYLPIDKEALR